MKNILSILALLSTALLVGGCASAPGVGSGESNLVVTALEKTGPATVNSEGQVEVPIRVTVRNQGPGPAQAFRTALEYQYHNHHNPYEVPFILPGQEDQGHAQTERPLAAGKEVSLSGTVIFPRPVRDVPVTLRAVAENNEDIDRSASLSLSLP